MEYLPAIISAIGTIIAAWLSYNQYTKNKLTDLKIEQFKKEEEARSERKAYCSAVVYNSLHDVLRDLKADRVYIVQPHPLGNESMLSIYYEVKRNGVDGMREKVQGLKMSEMAKFSYEMANNLFMFITDIDNEVEDKYAKSLLSSCGCTGAIIKRLNDNRYDWVGSIFCEFINPMEITEEEARNILHRAAMSIQYLLPELK